MARSKISFSLEIFNLARNLEFFLIFGPSGLLEAPNPEKLKAAQKWLKSDFRGLPQSNPKSNPKNNFLTRKN